VLEELTTCKSGAPTLDGSRSSNIETHISATFKTKIDVLMSVEAKMKKADQLSSGRSTEELTKDGRLYIKMKLKRFKKKDFMKTSDGTLTDHSISFLDFQ
jgi:hypothetical protein